MPSHIEVFATNPESMMDIPTFVQQGDYYLATFDMTRNGEGVCPTVIHLYQIERVTDISKVIYSDMKIAYDGYQKVDLDSNTFFYDGYELKLVDIKRMTFVQASAILSMLSIRYVIKNSMQLEDGNE